MYLSIYKDGTLKKEKEVTKEMELLSKNGIINVVNIKNVKKFLSITEKGLVSFNNFLTNDMIIFSDKGLINLINVSNLKKPLKYFDAEWITLENYNIKNDLDKGFVLSNN
jgi:hypothetical protein